MNDPTAYHAALERAAFADRSGRGKLVVAGADRLAFLHAMLTQDVQALAPGSGCYAAYLTPQGRMIADMRLYELGGITLLDVSPGLAAPLAARFDALVFSEDVQFGDVSDAWALFRTVGPGAAGVVHGVLSALGAAEKPSASAPGACQAIAVGPTDAVPSAVGLAGWPEFRVARVAAGAAVAIVASTHEWGLPGYDLFVERIAADTARATLLERAAPLEAASADALRVEAGCPEFPIDMDAETIPLEAGIEKRAISFTKGCYPGQEIVIRILHRGGGRVARRLVGLVVEGETGPRRGDVVMAAEKEAGRVTSAAWSPTLARHLALAYVHHDHATVGTDVGVNHDAGLLRARVAALPFVSHQ